MSKESREPVQFGKYLLDGEMASGGMSRVFRARLTGPGGFEKRLVVKQILPDLAKDPGFIELFVREANTLVQMSHSSIVPVYELGVVDGVYFLAMEMVEGATVAEILRKGPLPEAHVAHVALQICEALRYAHSRFQVVHRDVTPRNVIVDGDGHGRLLDFGIASPVESTGDGALFGSPGYMSPEQVRGETLGPASDLFSLGAVMYEALSGRRAFPKKSGEAPSVPLAPPPKLGKGEAVSEVIAELVDSMLQVDAQQRPASAQEVAAGLRRWLAHHHPQGVAAELGLRAEGARSRRDEAQGGSVTPSSERGAPREVRSIATSSVLQELIGQTTEPLPRPEPGTEPLPGRKVETPIRTPLIAPEDAAEHAAERSRVERYVVTVLVAAFAVGAWSLLRDDGRSAAPEPQPSTPVADVAEPQQPVEQAAQAAQAAQAIEQPGSGTATDAGADAASPARAARAAGSPRTPVAADTAKKGSLNVNALPWAQVSLDGKALGNTPRRRIRLRAGKHTLQLDCPPLGASTAVPIDIPAGGQLNVLVDLNQSPPTISIH